MNRPEILSPAGNFEKMRAAIRYGADAVYLAGHIFGMRAAADNFSIEELEEAVEYSHERGVKVYLTLNTMPREHEYLRASITVRNFPKENSRAFSSSSLDAAYQLGKITGNDRG